MSINDCFHEQGVVLFSGERHLIYQNSVKAEFQVRGSYLHYFNKPLTGEIYLTSHRVIFRHSNPKNDLKTLSLPFCFLKKVSVEQPVFGSNYVTGDTCVRLINCDSPIPMKFKFIFKYGGAIEFAKMLHNVGHMVSESKHDMGPKFDPQAGPPPYQENLYGGCNPAYEYQYAPPIGESLYNFAPYSSFPTAPPANSLYVYDAPPPYPGVGRTGGNGTAPQYGFEHFKNS